MFSAGAGQQALDRLGASDRAPNGLFTRVLLQEMQRPGIPVDQVLRNVREKVVQLARSVNHEQVPALYDQVVGQYYLVASLEPVAAPRRAEPIALPSGGEFSLEELKKQQAVRGQWEVWQGKMKAAYEQTLSFDGSPDLQVQAWEKFLANYTQDNPYSVEDESLRSQAESRKQTARSQQQQASARQEQQRADAERQRQALAQQGTQGGVGGPAMVRIPGKNYELGKYEVTQKEWREVMGSNPSRFSNCGDSCPVERVSWDDIQSFLQKLNAKTGRQYRLPTEAEWAYACQGGSLSEYCGGNDENSVAWYDGNSNGTTHPVGQKQANGYGLYDMSGNVWEWQSDCYNGDCAQRVLRGGSWDFIPQYVRAAFRYRFGAAGRYDDYGFRLARTLP